MYNKFLDSARVTVLVEDSIPYEGSYLAQHGLSLLIEAYRNGVKRNILVDIGKMKLLQHLKQ